MFQRKSKIISREIQRGFKERFQRFVRMRTFFRKKRGFYVFGKVLCKSVKEGPHNLPNLGTLAT